MSLEGTGLNATATLGADIIGSPATFTLASMSASWPTSGLVHVNIGDTESIAGTISGTTVTVVTRAVEAIGAFSTAQNHTAGDSVKLIFSYAAAKNLFVTKIDENILSGAVASVTFSGISGLYRHLGLELLARGDSAATFVTAALQFNGDVATSYIGGYVVRTGNANPTGAAPAPAVSLPIANITAATGPATYAGAASIKILGYSGTTFTKSVVSFNENQHGAAAAGQEEVLYSGNWAGTAAITSVKIILSAGNFIAGSMFSLYGIP